MRAHRCASFAALLTFLLTVTAVSAETHRRTLSRSFAAGSGTSVALENLAGAVVLEGSSGGQIEIEATIVAEDASRQEAERLTSLLDVSFEERDGRVVVEARYPVERYDTYHYPAEGGSGSWLFGGGSRSNTRFQGRKVTVVSRAGGGAITLYADFRLRLPAGVGAQIRNVAGGVEASGVDGPLRLDTSSGNIRVNGGNGTVSADTGSGDVEVSERAGAVNADTGSGDVLVVSVLGDVRADTGSGDVTLRDVEGGVVDADTGSGDILLEGVRGEIVADTGSGDVEGRDVTVIGRLEVDTGSGSVDLAGDLSAADELSIDTGSGSVSLESIGYPDMELRVSTGSGGIDVDLPGAEVLRRDKGSYHGRLGSGRVRASIETGSGRVQVRGR